MKRDYSKWCSVALIAAIYVIAGVAGWLLFEALAINPITRLFLADVLATIVVWAFGLLYENVSVYDPYWSVFPPIAFLLWAFYTAYGRFRSSCCLLLRGIGAGDSRATGPSRSRVSRTRTGVTPSIATASLWFSISSISLASI